MDIKQNFTRAFRKAVTTEMLYGYQIAFHSTAFLTPDTTEGLYGYQTEFYSSISKGCYHRDAIWIPNSISLDSISNA